VLLVFALNRAQLEWNGLPFEFFDGGHDLYRDPR